MLQSVKILCGNIKLQAMHSEMETEEMVIPAQTTGYLWVTSMETKLEVLYSEMFGVVLCCWRSFSRTAGMLCY